MIFIQRGQPFLDNSEWGINQCLRCSQIPPTGMLCHDCLAKRDACCQDFYRANMRSWEYRVRAWLSNWLKPQA